MKILGCGTPNDRSPAGEMPIQLQKLDLAPTVEEVDELIDFLKAVLADFEAGRLSGNSPRTLLSGWRKGWN